MLLTNTVVTTVMSNFGLYKAFDALDIDYAKTAVGDKYVYEYMMQNGCRIGGGAVPGTLFFPSMHLPGMASLQV